MKQALNADTKKILRAVTRSIAYAILEDPPNDWRESLLDSIDALDLLVGRHWSYGSGRKKIARAG